MELKWHFSSCSSAADLHWTLVDDKCPQLTANLNYQLSESEESRLWHANEVAAILAPIQWNFGHSLIDVAHRERLMATWPTLMVGLCCSLLVERAT